MNRNDTFFIQNRTKEFEGFRDKVYSCPAGKLTIGYGTNLESRGLTEGEASYLLINDVIRIEENLKAHQLIFGNVKINAVLIDMAYQMGVSGLLKFKNMLASIRSGDYQDAAEHLLDSNYAKQTPNRAEANAKVLRDIK